MTARAMERAGRATRSGCSWAEVDPDQQCSGVRVRGVDPQLTGESFSVGAAPVIAGEALASGLLATSAAFEPGGDAELAAVLCVSWERC